MRVTCLAPYAPYEGIGHAGGAFFQEFLATLGRQHDVNLIVPGLEVNQAAEDRRNPGVHIHRVQLSRLSRTKVAKALIYPFDLVDGVTLGTLLLRAIREDPVARALVRTSDVVEIHWSRCLPLAAWVRGLAPNAVITAWEYDVMYQSLTRRAAHASSFRLAFESRVTRHRVGRREPRLLNQCDLVFVFSEKDSSLLAELGVRVPVHVVDPLVVFPEDVPGPSASPNVLFVGAMDRAENVDAAFWFLDRVWPAVRRTVPLARLTIAGTSPPKELLDRVDTQTDITGHVESLDPYYRSARVVIVPLRMGAGVKFKVPQAMAYGLPVVATHVGAEGILDCSGPEIFAGVLDDAGGWVRLVTEMLTDHASATAVGGRGYRWVHKAYDFEASTETVVNRYRALSRR